MELASSHAHTREPAALLLPRPAARPRGVAGSMSARRALGSACGRRGLLTPSTTCDPVRFHRLPTFPRYCILYFVIKNTPLPLQLNGLSI